MRVLGRLRQPAGRSLAATVACKRGNAALGPRALHGQPVRCLAEAAHESVELTLDLVRLRKPSRKGLAELQDPVADLRDALPALLEEGLGLRLCPA